MGQEGNRVSPFFVAAKTYVNELMLGAVDRILYAFESK